MTPAAPFDPDRSLFDPDTVRRAFSLLVPADGVAEVRALEATSRNDRFPGVWFGYFTDADALLSAADAAAYAAKRAGRNAVRLAPRPLTADP